MNMRYWLLCLLLLPMVVWAQPVVKDLRIVEPIPGQTVAAAYLVLENPAATPIELVAVQSDSAGKIQIHDHVAQQGMMRMVERKSLVVEAGGTVEFVRGGLHLMVFSPDAAAVESGSFDIQFKFADGSLVHETARVEQLMPNTSNHGHKH